MFLLYQYLEGSPKKLTIQPTLLGSATQFPRSKSQTSNNWRSLQCLWRIIVGLNSPFSFLGNPHIFLDHIPIILGQYVHLVLPNPHDITATCWATCPYFGQTFHFCQEIRCFFRGLPWFFLWPSAQTSNLLRTNSPMEELREEVESNDDYHGHHHKIRYFYDCDICTIYTINLCVFFVFPTNQSLFEMGETFHQQGVFGWRNDLVTWSLWKGTPFRHDFWVLQLFRSTKKSPMGTHSPTWRVEERQVGPLSNSSKCWAVMCNNLEITVLVHTITQNGSDTILNCSRNCWDLIQQ